MSPAPLPPPAPVAKSLDSGVLGLTFARPRDDDEERDDAASENPRNVAAALGTRACTECLPNNIPTTRHAGPAVEEGAGLARRRLRGGMVSWPLNVLIFCLSFFVRPGSKTLTCLQIFDAHDERCSLGCIEGALVGKEFSSGVTLSLLVALSLATRAWALLIVRVPLGHRGCKTNFYPPPPQQKQRQSDADTEALCLSGPFFPHNLYLSPFILWRITSWTTMCKMCGCGITCSRSPRSPTRPCLSKCC